MNDEKLICPQCGGEVVSIDESISYPTIIKSYDLVVVKHGNTDKIEYYCENGCIGDFDDLGLDIDFQ